MRLGLCAFILASLCALGASAGATTTYPLTELQGNYYYMDGRSDTVLLDEPTSFLTLDIADYWLDTGGVVLRVYDSPAQQTYYTMGYPNDAHLGGSIWFPELNSGQPFGMPTFGPFSISVHPAAPVTQIQVSIFLTMNPLNLPPFPYGYSIEYSSNPTANVMSANLIVPEPSSLMALALGGVGMLVGLRKRRS